MNTKSILKPFPHLLRTLSLIGLFSAMGNAQSATDPVRVACVGDSITYGQGIAERETRSYPAQLQALLGDGFQVVNFGHSGTTAQKQPPHPYTSSYWKQKVFQNATSFEPNLVVLMLGTNDYWKPENWAKQDAFIADYKALIAHFASLPSRPRIVICTLAPAFEKTAGLSERQRECVAIIRHIASEAKLPCIDVDQVLAAHPEWFPDGCHPNQEGAAAIAQAVFASLNHQKPELETNR